MEMKDFDGGLSEIVWRLGEKLTLVFKVGMSKKTEKQIKLKKLKKN
jgi:hypothetical protein